MNSNDAEEFTQSLGQIVGGSWRQIALAKRLGVPKTLGLSVEKWVNDRLGGYVKLAVEDRREAVKELAEEGESLRDIGAVLGVSKSTVHDDLCVQNGTRYDDAATTNQPLTEESVQNRTPTKTPEDTRAPVDAVAALSGVKANAPHSHRTQGGGENEWYTPPEYIEAAREVMGRIDVDPASCAEAQAVIQAQTYYTIDDSGLTRDWRGKVWLNPPYGRGEIGSFTERLLAELANGRCTEAIMLTHNNTDTAWFHGCAKQSSMICFSKGRVAFYRGESVAAVPNGQVFFYFGDGVDRFVEHFGQFGFLAEYVSKPR